MVKTELSYNPYVRETIVKFNGQEPRINSQIEKYHNCKLQEWIDKIPSIFHDGFNRKWRSRFQPIILKRGAKYINQGNK